MHKNVDNIQTNKQTNNIKINVWCGCGMPVFTGWGTCLLNKIIFPKQQQQQQNTKTLTDS